MRPLSIHLENGLNEKCTNRLPTMISSDLQLKMASLVINNLRMLGTRPQQLRLLLLSNLANWPSKLLAKKLSVPSWTFSRYSTCYLHQQTVKMKQSDYFRYLGIHFDHSLTWSKHVTWIQSRVYPNLKLLNRILSFRSRNIFFRIYNQAVLPLLDYGCVV